VVSHPSCDQGGRDKRREAFADTNRKRATTKIWMVSVQVSITSHTQDSGRGEVEISWAYPIRGPAATKQSLVIARAFTCQNTARVLS
jgi:hypothetical protein